MASIQKKGEAYYCQFLYGGRRRTVTVGKVSEQSALAFAARTEELLGLLARGRIALPEGVEITDFVLADGRVEVIKPPEAISDEPVKFSDFKEKYLEARSGGSMEANSLATARMHLGHLERSLGADFDLRKLTLADLQSHLNRRRKEGDPRCKKPRKKPLSAATLRLEISTLRSAWNWSAAGGLVRGPFPSKGLIYPKDDEKPPYMTAEEIRRRTQGDDSLDLWECLYLRKEEITQLLSHVEEKATAPWVYPLVATAAHTGARRSELLRMEVADVDLEANTVLVREKKRSRKQRTTRRVSLTPALATVLREWLAVHPGGKHLFCQAGVVARSRKRSRTTGHKGEKTRASSLKGRTATVHRREQSVAPVTKDEAHDHLKRTLAGSRWEVLKGYHVLRHSFISCLAAEGVDQRIIDDFVGHCSDEQRRRYRHLVPDVKHRALAGVFG